jgi:hypothetical protein
MRVGFEHRVHRIQVTTISESRCQYSAPHNSHLPDGRPLIRYRSAIVFPFVRLHSCPSRGDKWDIETLRLVVWLEALPRKNVLCLESTPTLLPAPSLFALDSPLLSLSGIGFRNWCINHQNFLQIDRSFYHPSGFLFTYHDRSLIFPRCTCLYPLQNTRTSSTFKLRGTSLLKPGEEPYNTSICVVHLCKND